MEVEVDAAPLQPRTRSAEPNHEEQKEDGQDIPSPQSSGSRDGTKSGTKRGSRSKGHRSTSGGPTYNSCKYFH